MANIVAMPKLGLTMTEGVIAKWYKKVGETIEQGETLFEVTTDKLTNEIESDYSGVVLKLCAEEGESIPCTEPVAYIGEAGEKIVEAAQAGNKTAEAEEKAVEAEKSAAPEKAKREKGSYVLATPYAKKLAADKGYDISDIEATGPNGRVVAKDVENYTAGPDVRMSPTAAKMVKEFGVDAEALYQGERLMKADILNSLNQGKAPAAAAAEAQAEKTIKLTPMRKTISSRMSESWSTSPRVTYNRPVDTSAMKELRNKLNPVLKDQGIKISFNHILMKVCAKVLTEMPSINASLDGDMLTLHPHANIGLAIGLDSGLLVPNVKNCDVKSISEIAVETEGLIAATRDGKLKMDDMVGGTFTITNLGAYGISTFSPIINQPELAILGVDAIVETPVVVDGAIVIRPMMNLSLTADHRVIDGLLAAKFLKRAAEYLENPYMLLV